MSDWADVVRQRARQPELRRPPGTITIQPDEFSPTWQRVAAPVEFGLRLPPEQDIQHARSEAARVAVQLHDATDPVNRFSAFQDNLLAFVCARALCDPADVSKPHPVLPLPDDQIRRAFPSATLRRIWDEVERIEVEQSPLVPEADDDELGGLAAAIQTGKHLELEGAARARFRRYASHMIDVLEGT